MNEEQEPKKNDNHKYVLNLPAELKEKAEAIKKTDYRFPSLNAIYKRAVQRFLEDYTPPEK